MIEQNVGARNGLLQVSEAIANRFSLVDILRLQPNSLESLEMPIGMP